MEYFPYITEDGRAGLRCKASDGSISYIYLNPSSDNDERDADVFVYTGEANDPVEDLSVCFVVPTNTPERGDA